MKLPVQSQPVQRVLDQTHSRHSAETERNGIQVSSQHQEVGVNAADYGDCYNLRGLAQQLCLANY
jgi:hypothetical protein